MVLSIALFMDSMVTLVLSSVEYIFVLHVVPLFFGFEAPTTTQEKGHITTTIVPWCLQHKLHFFRNSEVFRNFIFLKENMFCEGK
jgi:hypothetical protein